jgi:hypothetical protein
MILGKRAVRLSKHLRGSLRHRGSAEMLLMPGARNKRYTTSKGFWSHLENRMVSRSRTREQTGEDTDACLRLD